MIKYKFKNLIVFLWIILAAFPSLANSNNLEILTHNKSDISQSQIITSPEQENSPYSKLENLLADNKWQEADEETYDLILTLTQRKRGGGINTRAIKEKISCEEISNIDRLWRKYSEDKFGLSIQVSIYLETGNNLEAYDPQSYQLFGDQLGWRKSRKWKKYEQLNFSENAPKGHLPIALRELDATVNIPEFMITKRLRRILYSKVQECNL
ncbi:MAG: GUN4 domain-containing protein [Okeania sp. SIO2G4]|uniref:GUN4 domain-containing protein n=1 Tax=unclassified Okeania TaxID=2634635 RepID=UPI0013BA9699|nr:MULTISPECIES: GUN4 domain-containing protein [unclassified Okeania]NEP06901.1 GUN4 domain-containing protein [Okeania sp. SIO4D6]NEP47156.1 GUN4 domain-containing protein [Okeania sp. SIO2H7]NEP70948.1 GUN4 domain-containing protein [Okeania sp. SIO2G5]NEP92272.1 GUN4 domain-containing protein [Okeania sp. SIO2F5]NEQ90000.1 GUN4 domain-containing protein [Okeania sp. SIO2G4]